MTAIQLPDDLDTFLDNFVLKTGNHGAPKRGTPLEQVEACVMELTSLLAGEPFSDTPECACPVLTQKPKETWQQTYDRVYAELREKYSAKFSAVRDQVRPLVLGALDAAIEIKEAA
jgi:hypothetical protein